MSVKLHCTIITIFIINFEALSDLSFFGYNTSTETRNLKSADVKALLGSDFQSFYSNAVGFENPTIMAISDVFVGILVYDMMLIDRGVFTPMQLHHWILKESACLHNKRSDVIIVIGNGDALFNQMVHDNYKSHYQGDYHSHKYLVVGIQSVDSSQSSSPKKSVVSKPTQFAPKTSFDACLRLIRC